MELKDISYGKPTFKLENLKKPTNTLQENSLSGIGKEKIASLRSAIDEINFLITQRESLSKNISEEVEKIKTEIENFLLKSSATDTDEFKERNGLRKKQMEFSELQLNEKINCWRDVALLKKELRELQRELNEKEDRMDMFGKILEE